MIEFRPVEKVVLSADEAAEYLGVTLRGLERLVQAKRLTPLRLGKRLVYARVELDELVLRELASERRLRGTNLEERS